MGVSRVGGSSSPPSLSQGRNTAREDHAHGVRSYHRHQHACGDRTFPAGRHSSRRLRGNCHLHRGMAPSPGTPHHPTAERQGKPHRGPGHGTSKDCWRCQLTGYHYVRQYRRKDGTMVRGHKRHNPPARIGARAVLLFVALLLILGSLAHAHGAGSGQRSANVLPQYSASTSGTTPDESQSASRARVLAAEH